MINFQTKGWIKLWRTLLRWKVCWGWPRLIWINNRLSCKDICCSLWRHKHCRYGGKTWRFRDLQEWQVCLEVSGITMRQSLYSAFVFGWLFRWVRYYWLGFQWKTWSRKSKHSLGKPWHIGWMFIYLWLGRRWPRSVGKLLSAVMTMRWLQWGEGYAGAVLASLTSTSSQTLNHQEKPLRTTSPFWQYGGILLVWSTTEICGTFSIGEWMDSWMGSSSRIGSNILQVFMDYCSASKGIPIHVVLYKLHNEMISNPKQKYPPGN